MPAAETNSIADRMKMSPGEKDLTWVSELLWGSGIDISVGRGYGSASSRKIAEFVVLPNARQAHLLVPIDSAPAAQQALRNYNDARRAIRGGAAVLGLAARVGVLGLVGERVTVWQRPGSDPGGGRLDAYLANLLGVPEVRIAVRMGGRRPNRKPVLQILTPGGDILAYAKLGWNPTTRALVRNETLVLAKLARSAGGRSFSTPDVIHSGDHGELTVLVMAPVAPTAWLRSRPSRAELEEVARDIAALGPLSRERLGASDFWQETRTRLEKLRDSVRATRYEVLDELTSRLEEQYGDVEVPFGDWHGDWTQWNMASDGSRLMIFDWERSGRRVPIGIDAAHHDFDFAVKFHKRHPLEVVRSLALGGGTVLPSFSAETAARLLVALDLLEMVFRYEEARVAGLDVEDTLYFGAFRAAVLAPVGA
jgi:Phosphotransferase enzyme family